MSDAEYFSRTELSNSDCKLINDSFGAYLNKGNMETTEAMAFGKMVHAYILEESEFWKKYVVAPVIDRRTTQGKLDWKQLESSGLEIVSAQQWVELNQIRQNVLNHPVASKIIAGGEREGVFFGYCNGVKTRSKIDMVHNGFIIDLKTSQSASKSEFMRSMANFNYHMQAAFYVDIAKQNGLDIKGFIFLVVEKKATTCGVGVYVIDEEAIDLGRKMYQRAIEKYKYHTKHPCRSRTFQSKSTRTCW